MKLFSLIRQKIFSGEYGVDGRFPSERDLADQFGYARMTVRAVLQEFVDLGLLEKRPYSGNFVTSWLRRSEDNSMPLFFASPKARRLHFGFLVFRSKVWTMEEDPYYNMLMLGFVNARHGIRDFEIETVGFDQADNPGSIFDELDARKIDYHSWDGMIIAVPFQNSDFSRLDDLHIPYVLQGEQGAPFRRSVVSSDNYHGGYYAALHLLEQNYTNPLLVYYCVDSSEWGKYWMQTWISGIQDAFQSRGISVDESHKFVFGSSDALMKRQVLERLESKAAYDSVICFGDWATIRVVDVIQKKTKLSIPTDIAIVSFDTYNWMNYSMKPAVTTVIQQCVRIGEYCIDELYRQMNCPNSETLVRMVMPVMTPRDSSIRK